MSDMILGIDWSSTRLSVAWRSEKERGEDFLELKRFQAEHALPMLEEVLNRIEEPKEIRIGRGPGNYSGIRQALVWAFGFTAPGGIRLKAYSSGRAQACRLAKRQPGPFAVLGDARRGVWWGAVFGGENTEWRLQTPEAWTEELAGVPVFSQEACRLQDAPFELCPDFPTAVDLLDLPEDFPVEKSEPLYLHPAV